jgi:diacylglycerol kinase (ATP)
LSSYARVIVNPAAGAGKTGKQWPQIMGLFRKHGLRFEHDMTEAPGHAVELAKAAVNKGYEMVVSVGGDGTINEIVNGLHIAGSNGDAVLGIISTGTGSDYIKSLGVPRKYEEACRLLVAPKKRKVDLGIVEYSLNGHRVERLFVNFAGMGFDAEVVRRTTQQFKQLGGMGSYLCGVLTTVVTYRNRDVELEVDGNNQEKKVCTVIMNIGRYGGGGMNTAPDAKLDDGLFDIMLIGNVNKPDLVWSLPRIYKGTHVTHPKVTMMRGKSIALTAKQPMYLQADGDLLGQAPASFRILPLALNVVV